MSEDQWDNRQEIKSESSGRKYVVARRKSTGLYECSCPGWKRTRHCKHLTSMGLPTQGPLQNKATSSRRSMSPSAVKARRNFADSKKHYDPMTEGYGNHMEWEEAAKRMAAGRGALKVPAGAVRAGRAEDLQALGMRAMPPTADDLLAAFQVRSDVLNDPVTGNPDEFWRAFSAYERLIKHY